MAVNGTAISDVHITTVKAAGGRSEGAGRRFQPALEEPGDNEYPFTRYSRRVSYRVVVLPGEVWSYPIREPKTTRWEPGEPEPLVELVFKDSDNQWWWRKPMGRIIKLDDPPPREFLGQPKIAAPRRGRAASMLRYSLRPFISFSKDDKR
jgi:hypothetical protein